MCGQQTNNCITVAVAPVSAYADTAVLPPYAPAELERITDPRVAAEKRAGYGLLASLGVDVRLCTRSASGKPMHPACCFSITHKAGVVAVAVGSQPLGLDIESVGSVKVPERLLDRIRHPQEDEADATLLWTKKEAVFKRCGEGTVFCPSAIDTTAFSTVTQRLTVAEREYILTLCADDVSAVEWPASVHRIAMQ